MSRLVAIYMDQEAGKYADSFRNEWKRRGEDVRKAFNAFAIQQVDAASFADFSKGTGATSCRRSGHERMAVDVLQLGRPEPSRRHEPVP
ncbi:hypothetical protein [Cupriavidus gilardii]|uniref:Uncharacterized protein n=1 Tax=Cupriavidus gilardii TaxID=82541 RepID=A0A849BCV1_9BURK|nr:hypothetical protein [Cupriavidus gilardii]QQE07786.1 hypothetical protein IC580_05475 [Cupriavidus sp. ISTL7]KAB0594336.1 hypothetical protein F7Q96_22025 [Cupriavidus gilardii]MCT9015862.1 hypothetical protein [Cupriavidus gilardii]MCT9055390.1 hypothetical protein [Cupriavidus gilardii]NNH13730.1 hypothetical protein [Cupriavidus gilardii]